MNKILVVDFDLRYGKAVEGLGKLTNKLDEFVEKPDAFSLVLFTGGVDVDPSYYGDTSPSGWCVYDSKRDEREAHIFSLAVQSGIKIAGICRGLQFINVMNGGRLIHHVTGHEGTHHDIETSYLDNRIIRVNSLHHQIIIPGPSCYVIGWSPERLSEIYIGNEDCEVNWPGPEIEAAYYPNLNAVGVQYHPEMMPANSDGYLFFYNMVLSLMTCDKAGFVEKYVRGVRNSIKTAKTIEHAKSV